MVTGFSCKLMPTVNFHVSAPPNQRESRIMQKNQACFLMDRLQFDTNSGTIESTAATQRSRTALYEAVVIRIIVIVS